MAKTQTNKTKPTAEDYEKLGRAVESAMITDYIDLLANTRRQIFSAFVRGIFTGFGTVLGATLLVTLLVWLLSTLGALPGVGEFFRGTSDAIQR